MSSLLRGFSLQRYKNIFLFANFNPYFLIEKNVPFSKRCIECRDGVEFNETIHRCMSFETSALMHSWCRV